MQGQIKGEGKRRVGLRSLVGDSTDLLAGSSEGRKLIQIAMFLCSK